LTAPAPRARAKRIFLKHDREGNGFIMAAAADAVLREVGCVRAHQTPLPALRVFDQWLL
jgi:hypothetical protein